MKQVRLISYQYPGTIRVEIKGIVYVYESSEYWCRRFMKGLEYGVGFHALNWFKGVASLIGKEKVNEKVL